MENGLTGVETDFHLSADGHLIVMHDNDIKRTSNGEGIVENMTLEQIKSFKLKNSDEQIPTAAELFELFAAMEDFYIELEMKPRYGELYSPERMDDFLEKLYALAAKMLSKGTYVFTCFSIPVLKRMKVFHPDAKTGLIGAGLTQKMIDAAVDAGCYSIAPTFDDTEQALVDKAIAAGLKVNLWHSETPELWKKARDMGATVSTNNHPVAVLNAIKAEGLV
ncbi:MAG: hypothetical protein IJS08_09135, partial [Victivallales bacterium]|nr:hypothetical protein [Victivallales bacterium]